MISRRLLVQFCHTPEYSVSGIHFETSKLCSVCVWPFCLLRTRGKYHLHALHINTTCHTDSPGLDVSAEHCGIWTYHEEFDLPQQYEADFLDQRDSNSESIWLFGKRTPQHRPPAFTSPITLVRSMSQTSVLPRIKKSVKCSYNM